MKTLYHGDCLKELLKLPDHSVDLILADPPYNGVKKESWDNQWRNKDEYLAWLELIIIQLKRVLNRNGTLYLFASPKMTAKVEVLIDKHLRVLNNIRWDKTGVGGRHRAAEKKRLNSWYDAYESIICAEQNGGSTFEKAADRLRGEVFAPLIKRLKHEADQTKLTNKELNEALGCSTRGSGMARHYFSGNQYMFISEKQYKRLAEVTGRFQLPYSDYRREYEALSVVYKETCEGILHLKRPFMLDPEKPYTATWGGFKSVQHYPGKHPCEKPLPILSHIVDVSARPGSTVLDPFMGTGNTGIAALKASCRFIGIERDPAYFQKAKERLSQAA